METEEFDRNVDENDEPTEGSETGIADDPAQTDESGSTDPNAVATPEGTTEEDLEDRGNV
jgi:hypothetical protein